MQSMSKQSVVLAGCAVAFAAVLGIYFGVSRSINTTGGPADEAGAIVAPVTPVASAKPLLTPTPTMDEAEVRRLAREEAQGVLRSSQVKKAAAAKDDDDDDSEPDQLTPVNPPVPLLPIKPASPPPTP